MPTTRLPAMVSRALLAAALLAPAACVTAPRALVEAPAAALAIPFDNLARDYVHVYLVGERREWLLGRVEAGASARLRVPEAALASGAGPVRLAVVVGDRVTLRAADAARATATVPQPAASLLAMRWTYSGVSTGQLASLRR